VREVIGAAAAAPITLYGLSKPFGVADLPCWAAVNFRKG
jgi:hypothetical protein